MFPQLPDELSLAVLNLITDTRDLKRLCEVSKVFHNILIDRLYENFVLRATNEDVLDKLNWTTTEDTEHDLDELGWTPYTDAFGYLSKVKNFAVSSNFHTRTEQRCIHAPDWVFKTLGDVDNAAREYPIIATKSFRNMAFTLSSIVLSLPTNSLQSFRWELGSCIPLALLFNLTRTQPSLKRLSLVLGGSCTVEHRNSRNDSNDNHIPFDFTSIHTCVFNQLEELSVVNRNAWDDLIYVGKVLGANQKTLTKLELDCMDDTFFDYSSDVGLEHFAYTLFHVDVIEPSNSQWPVLKSLTLGAFDFGLWAGNILHTLNLPRLTSLKLRNCKGTKACLTAILDHDDTIDLTSLEISNTHESNEDVNDLYHTMLLFLDTYDGLENLFLGFNGCFELVDGGRLPHFVDLVQKQGKNLKRFVLHVRHLDEVESYYGRGHDILDLCYANSIYDHLFKLDNVYHPFHLSVLECLGLSCEPHTMRGLVLPFTKKSTLKILHMRRSGQDRDLRGPTTDRRWGIEREEDDFDSSPDFDSYSDTDNHADTDTHPPETPEVLITPPQADPLFPFHATKRHEISQLPDSIFEFLNWLFGPECIASLRIFAYGDFSHNGRFRAYNHIFCRVDASGYVDPEPQDEAELGLNWRPIRATDHELWGLIERNKDFLGCCATDPLCHDSALHI